MNFPGAPEYHAYMNAQEGKLWQTRAHETHAEYQTMIKDIVLESTWAHNLNAAATRCELGSYCRFLNTRLLEPERFRLYGTLRFERPTPGGPLFDLLRMV